MIPPKYLLSADHYEKFILGKSKYLSGFSSLDVFYPGFEFDSRLDFSLLKMSIVNNHKIIAFPISLALLYAFLIPFEKAYAIYLLSAFLIGTCLYFFGKEFQIPSWQIFLFSILSPIVINGYLFMDVGVGLFLFVTGMIFYQRSKENHSILQALIGTILISLSYWFQLGSLTFIGLYWDLRNILLTSLMKRIYREKSYV